MVPKVKETSKPSKVLPSPNILLPSKKFLLKSIGCPLLTKGAEPLAVNAGKYITKAINNSSSNL
jgi:hypothetical protein